MLEAAFFFWVLGLLLFSRLPTLSGGIDDEALVSVVIPARDEQENIERLVESLRAQSPAPLEILVVDDDSKDATAERARQSGATVLRSRPLPEGWAGKPWACWQGAQQATGELLLFLDADTWLEPGALGRLVATFRRQPGLVSVQPYHRMVLAYERLGALFNLITMMGTGAFTVLGSRIEPRIAFGPCVLVDREAYLAVGGHARAKRSVVEGSELAEAFHDAGHPVRCFGGLGSLGFRMYPAGPRSMAGGLAKSFATGAGAVPRGLLVAIVAWVVGSVTTTRHLIVGSLGGGVPAAALLLYALYALQLRWMLGRAGNYGLWPALLFPIPVSYFLGVFLYSSFRTFVRRDVSWKGRSVEMK
jgi:4,4'-diaponeurosporenoate glycosyltransferase